MILYTAAHGGFASEAVPLGGGAAVFDHLVEEWVRTRPFEFRTITPAILSGAPAGRDLVNYSERDYASFCRAFEHASTEEILKYDPASTTVLVNDVSEGPDFRALGERGYRIFTIYHVDVVAYIAAIYLKGWIAPETTVRWERRLRPLLPSLTRLIWEKQAASVEWSRGLIVPSAGMRDVIMRCYNDCPREKIHVMPWGVFDDSGPAGSGESLRREFNVPQDAKVLLLLSRISPEKGQHVLLESLLDWDPDVWVFMCGGAAYMRGQQYLEKLHKLAAKFRRTRVIFPGHVTGDRKRAFFAMADLYVFPSVHESYGLTLLEALAAGVPAVCVDSLGAREVMRPEFGAVVPRGELRKTIERLLGDDSLRAKMSAAAQAFAEAQKFSATAARLAGLLAAN